MPKFKRTAVVTYDIVHDKKVKVDFDVHINSEGKFYAHLPDAAWHQAAMALAVGSRTSREKHPRWVDGKTAFGSAFSNTLDELMVFLHDIHKATLEAQTRTEVVILYGYECRYAMCEYGGEMHPSGYGSDKENYKWHSSGSDMVGAYSLGMSAAVYEKHVVTRAGEDVIKYSQASVHDYRLNRFIHLDRTGLADRGMSRWQTFTSGADLTTKEIPYSAEAEAFFCNTMLSIAVAAKRVKDFLGDDGAVQLAIATGGQMLLGKPE